LLIFEIAGRARRRLAGYRDPSHGAAGGRKVDGVSAIPTGELCPTASAPGGRAGFIEKL